MLSPLDYSFCKIYECFFYGDTLPGVFSLSGCRCLTFSVILRCCYARLSLLRAINDVAKGEGGRVGVV